MSDFTFRKLEPGDEALLEDFLRPLADSSMFLRSNARKGGLADQGQPDQGTYVAAFADGRIRGVAAHFGNGVVSLQGEGHLPTLLDELGRCSPRAIAALLGGWDQAIEARRLLGLDGADFLVTGKETLFSIELDRLVVPAALASGRLRCRRPAPADAELVTRMRCGYCQESLGEAANPAAFDACMESTERAIAEGTRFLLTEGDQTVASSAFNAQLPDIVQVGGVWTPPALRSRGYGRAVVAGSLLIARAEGVRRSVLFTDHKPSAAQRAYLALGYQPVGDYAVLILKQPQPFPR